jgi:dihydrofolate synthase / folylpolyglutamate synthase
MAEQRQQPDPLRPGAGWSAEEAEDYILSLERFGMRFGLDRMRRLMTAMGLPHERFESIHVVGTNGKSSTTRMIAAILERHGLCTGAYTSPHLVSFGERIEVDERHLTPQQFADAVARAARAVRIVDRTLAEDDRVTQFEALTAAAYSELARRGVQVAVIEAGLGGRYDATNVIDAGVVVLTTVGLEHTRWLGPTVTDIAREKLAVVKPGTTLVIGADLHPEARAVATEVAARQDARLIEVPGDLDPALTLRARGAFQRRNFGLAIAAARAHLARSGRELEPGAVADAAATLAIRGRLQQLDGEPLTLLDGAHNADGVAALVEALPELVGDRPLTAIVSILDDKDAAAMLALLLPHCAALVCTAATNPRALSPATLESLARQLETTAATPTTIEPNPRRALAGACAAAAASNPPGAVLVTGSIYLIADLLRGEGARASTL